MERLLAEGQQVVGLDDFSTGYRRNLPAPSDRFRFIEGDCADAEVAKNACEGIDYVLHQAALGSVPRSMAQPLRTHRANVDGFIQMLDAARLAKVRRFVFASSSSVYGDDIGLPKVEARIGRPLSPYAMTKLTNEIYADTYRRAYGFETVGLRYFNVFGPRQDPEGAYAAVVPRWVTALGRGETCDIYGDGKTSRDFCFVANAVQANLKAATAPDASGAYNIAVGQRTSLTRLYEMIRERVAKKNPEARDLAPRYLDTRPGDIRDSQADISRATASLGYAPTHTIEQGLDETV